MESPRLPDPPPPRPATVRPARRRPAARARIVAGALSVLAFLGIGAATASDHTPAVVEQTSDASTGSATTPGWGAAPGTVFPGQPPVTSSHGS